MWINKKAGETEETRQSHNIVFGVSLWLNILVVRSYSDDGDKETEFFIVDIDYSQTHKEKTSSGLGLRDASETPSLLAFLPHTLQDTPTGPLMNAHSTQRPPKRLLQSAAGRSLLFCFLPA